MSRGIEWRVVAIDGAAEVTPRLTGNIVLGTEENLAEAIEHVTSDTAWRQPLPTTPYTPGNYHGM